MTEPDRPVFPNFAGKHEHQAMFSPKDFLDYAVRHHLIQDVPIPQSVILVYSRNLFRYIGQHEGVEPIGFISWPGQLYRLPTPHENIGVMGGFGIGAPTAAARLEELIAGGATRFLNIGAAGALQKECSIGDIVVCTQAVRDEGVSHHYLAAGKYSSPTQTLTERLKEVLDQEGLAYREGSTWTIDAPYRETVEEARHYQSEGVVTVDMEAAAVFAVGGYRGVEVAAAFVVSDSLAELVWEPKFASEELRDGLEKLFHASVDSLT
jgi:uridine phosphorylase